MTGFNRSVYKSAAARFAPPPLQFPFELMTQGKLTEKTSELEKASDRVTISKRGSRLTTTTEIGLPYLTPRQPCHPLRRFHATALLPSSPHSRTRLFHRSPVAPLDLQVEVILMRIAQLCATFPLTLRRYDRLHLTSEKSELIFNLYDKVTDEGPDGAHNVVAALLKRLTHRNPNELASRAWTAGLERVVTDMWTPEFADDSTLGVMGECYEALKAKNYKYTRPDTPPPPTVDGAIRRREEEELQRVLEMSVRDRGGGARVGEYAFELSDSGAGGLSSSASAAGTGAGAGASANGAGAGGSASGGYAGGYMPAAEQEREREGTPSPGVGAGTGPTTSTSEIPPGTIVTRVRALHPFAPTEAGELGFEKGDVIKVVDRGYKEWWRGQLRGRTGIFPVNYVEPLPDPTPAELAAEAAAEGAVFAQAVNVERLLNVLRGIDPERDNLVEDEEVQSASCVRKVGEEDNATRALSLGAEGCVVAGVAYSGWFAYGSGKYPGSSSIGLEGLRLSRRCCCCC
ncbi:hypothetical protein K438DRAFT_2011320 [Mycena galopus ATCC 62051]|nr:hypothetical protein K438DRAFT_2011320 [Mycena galopus ATCC 62051]